MKIINWIKEKFSKSVKINSKDDLLSLSSQSGWIKLNKKLIVPAGYICLLVSKEKVCDRFLEGEHKLSVENIPALTRVLKLNVPNKKGDYKQKFYADIYFINLSIRIKNKFCSQQGIYIKKDKEFLGTTAYVKGEYDFKVEDPILLLEALLKIYGKLNGSSAQRQIDIWTGELIDKCIQKNKPNIQKLYERDTNCFVGMIDYLNKNAKDIGLQFSRVEISSTLLPKNVYKKASLRFNENIEKQKEEVSKTINTSTTDKHEAIIDFGSEIKTLQTPTEKIKPTLEKINGDYHIDENYKDINQEESKDDDALDTHYNSLQEIQSKLSYKKCKQCGSFNSKDALVCFNCKANFKKTCEHCGEEITNGDFVCPKCKSIVI